MDIQKLKRTGQVSQYSVTPIGKGSGNMSSFSFQNALQDQFREYYKNRADNLFEEISAQASLIVDRSDINEFEKYRRLIGELLNEVINNAYTINFERILEPSGKRRIYASVKIINSKLECLAADLLDRNSDGIDYLYRIDEIRGLVMDLLF